MENVVNLTHAHHQSCPHPTCPQLLSNPDPFVVAKMWQKGWCWPFRGGEVESMEARPGGAGVGGGEHPAEPVSSGSILETIPKTKWQPP